MEGRSRAEPGEPGRASSSAPILCQNVRKAYRFGSRAVEALRGADLAIESSGLYGVMGQSGSGKSTLLHLLAALDRPDEGHIAVSGVAVGVLSERQATEFRRHRIGIVFQQFNLIPTMTARQNIELPGMLAGERPVWLRQRSDALLEELGLTDRSDHRPAALSGGEQQRVAIARALFYQPPVVLADEPTGNLDATTSRRLWTLLGEIAQRNDLTVLMVTHEPEAAAHCQRVFIIHDGRVTGSFETEGLDAGGVAARAQQCFGPA